MFTQAAELRERAPRRLVSPRASNPSDTLCQHLNLGGVGRGTRACILQGLGIANSAAARRLAPVAAVAAAVAASACAAKYLTSFHTSSCCCLSVAQASYSASAALMLSMQRLLETSQGVPRQSSEAAGIRQQFWQLQKQQGQQAEIPFKQERLQHIRAGFCLHQSCLSPIRRPAE
ncbi:hypothetical protein Emed_007576 [Eimeria media]